MNIVLATPLYPPDIAEPAPYVKAFTKHLSQTDEITLVVYGRYPERVDGVKIITVNKRHVLPFRLLLYTIALWKEARSADVLYIQNGPSVELPALIVSMISSIPIIIRIGDLPAHTRAGKNFLLNFLEKIVVRRAKAVISEENYPLPRPEILPFAPFPSEGLALYERSCNDHTLKLRELFRKYSKKKV